MLDLSNFTRVLQGRDTFNRISYIFVYTTNPTFCLDFLQEIHYTEIALFVTLTFTRSNWMGRRSR